MDLSLPFLGQKRPSVFLNSNVDILVGRVELPTKLVFETNSDRNPIQIELLSNIHEKKNSSLTINNNVYSVLHDNNIVLNLLGNAMSFSFAFEMLNAIRTIVGEPYAVGKIVANDILVDKVVLSSNIEESNNVVLNATVTGDNTSIDINIPMTMIDKGSVVLEGVASMLNYAITVPVSEYDVSLSFPVNVIGNILQGTNPKFSMSANIKDVDITINSEIYNEDQIRYKITTIDSGIVQGKIKIFPNQWTMCFANKPTNENGTPATVSSFLLPKLIEKYGDDIHTKISMIVAKHPETGEEYNFIIQDDYMTSPGTVNDFNMCYLKNDVFYPIPFMVQSITDENLEIDWEV